jgi:hypothetical protein
MICYFLGQVLTFCIIHKDIGNNMVKLQKGWYTCGIWTSELEWCGMPVF